MRETNWEKTKSTSKKGFDSVWRAFDKLGAPVNRLSNKLGSEAFWPTTLDKESDKAARILRSFCKEGFYEQVDAHNEAHRKADDGAPKGKQRVVKTIPPEVIRQAKGLAIFTTMRTGLWVSGSGGSGILMARIPETGEWSPPSGIMLHTAGLGFLIGVDIYDCVLVINDYKALEAFKKVRCTVGGEVSAAAGPVGVGGMLDTEVHKRRAPIWTYLKSRGFYAGVQIDGTIVIERTDENERFYGERIGVEDILAGKVRHRPYEIETLLHTVKAAQGDSDYSEGLLPSPGAPADNEIEHDLFAIPDPEDPDPYGVKALQEQGIVIREAASKDVPSMDTFQFRPSEKSPIYKRWSTAGSKHNSVSWRNSIQSNRSTDRGTQTDVAPPNPGSSSVSHRSRSSSRHNFTMSPTATEHGGFEETNYDGASVIQANQTSPTNPAFSRARLVEIPKRTPPPLPPRNPERFSLPAEPMSESEARERAEEVDIEKERETTFIQLQDNEKLGNEKLESEMGEAETPKVEVVPSLEHEHEHEHLEEKKPSEGQYQGIQHLPETHSEATTSKLAVEQEDEDDFHSLAGTEEMTSVPLDDGVVHAISGDVEKLNVDGGKKKEEESHEEAHDEEKDGDNTILGADTYKPATEKEEQKEESLEKEITAEGHDEKKEEKEEKDTNASNKDTEFKDVDLRSSTH